MKGFKDQVHLSSSTSSSSSASSSSSSSCSSCSSWLKLTALVSAPWLNCWNLANLLLNLPWRCVSLLPSLLLLQSRSGAAIKSVLQQTPIELKGRGWWGSNTTLPNEVSPANKPEQEAEALWATTVAAGQTQAIVSATADTIAIAAPRRGLALWSRLTSLSFLFLFLLFLWREQEWMNEK